MKLNEISYQIRGSFFTVCNELVPGLLERVYEQVLIIKLQNKKLQVQSARVQSSGCGSYKFKVRELKVLEFRVRGFKVFFRWLR